MIGTCLESSGEPTHGSEHTLDLIIQFLHTAYIWHPLWKSPLPLPLTFDLFFPLIGHYLNAISSFRCW